MIERIEIIAAHGSRIELTNMDAVALIKRYKSKTASKTLCYLDPPYYVKGKDLYSNYYNDDGHRKIAEAIMKYKGKWIISYDAVEFIKKLYKDYRQTEYYLSYSAGTPSKGRELLIFSDGLILPKIEVVRIKLP